MDLTGYTSDEIKLVATKLSKQYGPFNINGAELVFVNNSTLEKDKVEDAILGIIKTQAEANIDSIAEVMRNQILTPGDGQKIAYAYKYEEAKEILSQPENAKLNPEDYIMLAAELQVHGATLTLREIARMVMDKVIYSKKAFAFIEVRRYTLHNNIQAAITRDQIYNVVKNAKFDLPNDL